jgi:hypothetical protein
MGAAWAKSLGGGYFVDKVQIHIHNGRGAGFIDNDVVVPNLFK